MIKLIINYIIPYSFIAIWFIFSILYLIQYPRIIKSIEYKPFFPKNWFNIHLLDAIPSVFTTLGIFGTFIGIAYGLWNFDVLNGKDLTSSIKELLAGLTTAFITSIFGLILSLVFSRFVEYIHKTLDDIQEAKDEAILKAENEFRNQIIQSITTSLNDNFKTVIHSLEQNIKDFIENTKQSNANLVSNLTDKFSNFLDDNFSKLQESIERLINLQNNNQQHIEKVYESLNAITEKLSEASNILTSITNNIHQLTGDNSILHKILQELNTIIVKESEFSKSVTELKNITQIILTQTQQIDNNNQLLTKSIQREEILINESKNLLKRFDDTKNTFDSFITKLNAVPSHLQTTSKEIQKIIESVEILSNSKGTLKKLVGEEVENRREIIEEYGKIINRTASQLQGWYNQEQEFSKLMQGLIRDLQKNDWIKRENSFTKAIQDLIEKIETTESYRLQITNSWEEIKNQYIELKDDFVEKIQEEKDLLTENLKDINSILNDFINIYDTDSNDENEELKNE